MHVDLEFLHAECLVIDAHAALAKVIVLRVVGYAGAHFKQPTHLERVVVPEFDLQLRREMIHPLFDDKVPHRQQCLFDVLTGKDLLFVTARGKSAPVENY